MSRFCYQRELRGVFEKKHKKNMKMLHAGVILSKQKKYIRGKGNKLKKKTLKFHQYIRPITSQHWILKCVFFFDICKSKSRASFFFKTNSPKMYTW